MLNYILFKKTDALIWIADASSRHAEYCINERRMHTHLLWATPFATYIAYAYSARTRISQAAGASPYHYRLISLELHKNGENKKNKNKIPAKGGNNLKTFLTWLDLTIFFQLRKIDAILLFSVSLTRLLRSVYTNILNVTPYEHDVSITSQATVFYVGAWTMLFLPIPNMSKCTEIANRPFNLIWFSSVQFSYVETIEREDRGEYVKMHWNMINTFRIIAFL